MEGRRPSVGDPAETSEPDFADRNRYGFLFDTAGPEVGGAHALAPPDMGTAQKASGADPCAFRISCAALLKKQKLAGVTQ